MTVVRKLKAHVKWAMLNVLAIAGCCSTVLASEEPRVQIPVSSVRTWNDVWTRNEASRDQTPGDALATVVIEGVILGSVLVPPGPVSEEEGS